MKQHITQDQVYQLEIKTGMDEEIRPSSGQLTALCNAAIQSYIDAQAKELPEMPEPAYSHYGHGLVPVVGYTADQLKAYGLQCAAHAREKALSEAKRYRVLRDSDYQHHEDDISVADSSFNVYFGEDLDRAVDELEARHEALKGK